MAPYRIVLAEDHTMFRQGIRKLIEEMEDVQVSGEVQDGRELLDFLQVSVPDLIILDIAMPQLRGLEALREVKKHYPQVKVIILTMHNSKEFIRQAVHEGADGFILKEESSSELIRAIERVRAGKKYFSARLSEALVTLVREEKEQEPLTTREVEVLRCLGQGMSPQKIAESLFISVHTVRRHRFNIIHKLNLDGTADLIKYAITKGYAEKAG